MNFMKGFLKKLHLDSEVRNLKRITVTVMIFSFIIVLVVSSALIAGTSGIVSKEIYKANIGLLSQIEMYFDMYFVDNLNTIVTEEFIDISNDKDMVEFFSTDNCSMGAYYRLINYVSLLKQNNNFIDSIYLYSSKNDVAVSSSEGLIKDAMRINYSNVSKVQYEIKKNNRNRQFWISPAQNNADTITFVQLMPTIDFEKCDGYVAVNIDVENVVKSVSNKVDESGDIAILSSDGVLLAHSNKEILKTGNLGLDNADDILDKTSGSDISKYGRDSYGVLWIHSSKSGMIYVMQVPEQMYNNRIRLLQLYSMLVVLGMLLVTFFSSKYLSKWVIKPIEKNASLLEEKLVYDIIHGSSSGEDDIKARLEMLDKKFIYEKFYLIIFEASELSFGSLEPSLKKKKMREAFVNIQKTFSTHGISLCAKVSSTQISVIYNTSGNTDNVNEICRATLEHLKYECDLPFNVAVSDFVSQIKYINSVYGNLCKALEYGYVFGDNNIFDYNSFQKWESNYISINSEQQKTMEGYLRIGETTLFMKCVLEIIDKIKSNKYSIISVKSTLVQIVSIMQSIVLERQKAGINDGADIFSHVENIKSIDEYVLWLGIILESFDKETKKKPSSGQKDFIDRVQKYIDENISDDISLNSVAEAMNISPNYLSKIFREETGINFSNYVGDKKLDLAAELLRTTKTSVSEISVKVGYANVAYFTKLFKQKYGNTPGQYRKYKNN